MRMIRSAQEPTRKLPSLTPPTRMEMTKPIIGRNPWAKGSKMLKYSHLGVRREMASAMKNPKAA